MTLPIGTEFTLTPEEEAALGDPGKAAIDRMKAAQKDANTRAAAAEAELVKLRAPKPEPAKPAPVADDKPIDVASLIKAEADKIRADSLNEKAADKLEARAGKLLADPADAARYLKVSDFVSDGVVDVGAMDAALEQLVKDKPYLKSNDGKPQFDGSADGGPKGVAPGANQLTQTELNALAAQGQAGMLKIEEHRLAGRLNALMGIKK